MLARASEACMCMLLHNIGWLLYSYYIYINMLCIYIILLACLYHGVTDDCHRSCEINNHSFIEFKNIIPQF